jgi:hypothetical protein
MTEIGRVNDPGFGVIVNRMLAMSLEGPWLTRERKLMNGVGPACCEATEIVCASGGRGAGEPTGEERNRTAGKTSRAKNFIFIDCLQVGAAIKILARRYKSFHA